MLDSIELNSKDISSFTSKESDLYHKESESSLTVVTLIYQEYEKFRKAFQVETDKDSFDERMKNIESSFQKLSEVNHARKLGKVIEPMDFSGVKRGHSLQS